MMLRILFLAIFTVSVFGAEVPKAGDSPSAKVPSLQKRWLFVWRNLSDPKEVDRMIARFPRAAAVGYNGVVFSHDVAPEKARDLKQAAKQSGLDLIPIVMGGAPDRNYTEGVLVQD